MFACVKFCCFGAASILCRSTYKICVLKLSIRIIKRIYIIMYIYIYVEREEDNKKKRHVVVCIIKLCSSFPPAIPSRPGTSSFSRPDYLRTQIIRSHKAGCPGGQEVRLEGIHEN